MADLLLTGARPLAADAAASILLRDGMVAAIGPGAEVAGAGLPRAAADGLLLSPGFIDLQVNGAFGHDFTSDPSAAWEVGGGLAASGVTAFLPTLVSAAPATYEAAFAAWAERPAASTGAQPLGWHFEGPMLSPARRGAHRPEHLRIPDAVDLDGWTAERGLRLVTLAPELPGALTAAARLRQARVQVSAGHTDADAACGALALDAGVRGATHLLNAMRGLDHRRPGIAAALLIDPRATIGLIADGAHLADAMLALVWRVAGPGRVALVSDSMAALGAGPGRYRLGDATVEVGPEGTATADGRLAGGTTPLDEGLRRLVAVTGCSAAEALTAVTRVPAQLLGLADRGRLDLGVRADLVLLTDDLRVAATVVGGEVVYGREALAWR